MSDRRILSLASVRLRHVHSVRAHFVMVIAVVQFLAERRRLSEGERLPFRATETSRPISLIDEIAGLCIFVGALSSREVILDALFRLQALYQVSDISLYHLVLNQILRASECNQ